MTQEKPQRPSAARVFFALWPDPATRDKLAEAAARLPDKAGRKIPPDNFHITLLFLGSIPRDLVETLREDVKAVSATPFTLTFDTPGWWKKPRVFWLAPSSIDGQVNALVGQLNNIAESRALPTEKRAFRPHLTLMRKVARQPEMPPIEPVIWHVDNFCLVESVTRQSGPEYTVIDRWPLNG